MRVRRQDWQRVAREQHYDMAAIEVAAAGSDDDMSTLSRRPRRRFTGFSAARDDLLKIVDAIPGIPAQQFVTALEKTVSDSATKAVQPLVLKGAIVSAAIGVVAILIARSQRRS